MKKTYIIPEMITVCFGMVQPIAGSMNVTGESTGTASFYEENATGNAMAKGFSDKSIWDEVW